MYGAGCIVLCMVQVVLSSGSCDDSGVHNR